MPCPNDTIMNMIDCRLSFDSETNYSHSLRLKLQNTIEDGFLNTIWGRSPKLTSFESAVSFVTWLTPHTSSAHGFYSNARS